MRGEGGGERGEGDSSLKNKFSYFTSNMTTCIYVKVESKARQYMYIQSRQCVQGNWVSRSPGF